MRTLWTPDLLSFADAGGDGALLVLLVTTRRCAFLHAQSVVFKNITSDRPAVSPTSGACNTADHTPPLWAVRSAGIFLQVSVSLGCNRFRDSGRFTHASAFAQNLLQYDKLPSESTEIVSRASLFGPLPQPVLNYQFFMSSLTPPSSGPGTQGSVVGEEQTSRATVRSPGPDGLPPTNWAQLRSSGREHRPCSRSDQPAWGRRAHGSPPYLRDLRGALTNHTSGGEDSRLIVRSCAGVFLETGDDCLWA